MRIVHIAPTSSFTEGWSYQENLLPKYQKKMGNEVSLIVVNKSRPNMSLVEVPCDDFISVEGFRVIRRPLQRYNLKMLTYMFSKMNVYDLLLELKPDYIFFHGLVSKTIDQVVAYKKRVNSNVIIVMDNHLDYNIGGLHGSGFKTILLRAYYRHLIKKNLKSISMVYGVTPWRKEYAIDVFGVPEEKTDVLIMGADDEKLHFEHRLSIRESTRRKYGIENDTFLIVSGGKLDLNKKIHLLMEACGRLNKVKLIVFGNVLNDIKITFDDLCNKYHNIIYVGWASAEEQYSLYFAADLIAFPGQHSVMWEQACASKTPCVFAKWIGMDHVNNGGNADFFDDLTVDGIRCKIEECYFTSNYEKMKQIAASKATDIYLYSRIASKTMEDINLFK